MRVALACFVLTAALPGAAATTGAPLAAVWKERHVEFFYMGRTSRYSCEGLSDKVRALLIDFGARRDLRISAKGCDDAGTMLKAPNHTLSIVFTAPALPDASVKPLHDGDLAAADARYVPFKLASDVFRNMGVGDCELVEEFARQLLPLLATRELKQDIACTPNQLSLSRFMVQGEILKTLPPAETSPRSAAAPSP